MRKALVEPTIFHPVLLLRRMWKVIVWSMLTVSALYRPSTWSSVTIPSCAQTGPHISNISEKRNIRVLDFMFKTSKNHVVKNLVIHFDKRTSAIYVHGSS